MPNLQHNAAFERHMTLASMAQCPRAWWHTDRIRRGVEPDRVAGESLMVGIGVHAGLAHLWGQVNNPMVAVPARWIASAAMGAIVQAMPGSDKKIVTEAEKAVADYALQWIGVRDHWVPIAIEPNAQPPAPWTVLEGKFVAYPDLIVTAGEQYPLLVVDYKTSKWKYSPDVWEYHPELLTQCLAAKQLKPDVPVWYMVDFLQRPGYKSTVWSFPVTTAWEFDARKEEMARDWVRQGLEKIRKARWAHGDRPLPRELSQCQTRYGICQFAAGCLGGEE